jgi:hypothetical protein
VVKELFQYVFVSETRNYKVNFTMFITAIKAVRNSCVFGVCEELQILFADSRGIWHHAK